MPDAADDPIADLGNNLQDLRCALADAAVATMDSARIYVRDKLIALTLLFAGAIVGVGLVLGSLVLLLVGMAGGISAALKSPPWVGYLIAGILVPGITVLGIRWSLGRMRREQRAEMENKYAKRT